ncbi:MAG TPA: hypothetical protein VKC60_09475 [Opitutaceae bacterium]|nr:hypothetical protein [Opitutaceae bacterium]
MKTLITTIFFLALVLTTNAVEAAHSLYPRTLSHLLEIYPYLSSPRSTAAADAQIQDDHPSPISEPYAIANDLSSRDYRELEDWFSRDQPHKKMSIILAEGRWHGFDYQIDAMPELAYRQTNPITPDRTNNGNLWQDLMSQEVRAHLIRAAW